MVSNINIYIFSKHKELSVSPKTWISALVSKIRSMFSITFFFLRWSFKLGLILCPHRGGHLRLHRNRIERWNKQFFSFSFLLWWLCCEFVVRTKLLFIYLLLLSQGWAVRLPKLVSPWLLPSLLMAEIGWNMFLFFFYIDLKRYFLSHVLPVALEVQPLMQPTPTRCQESHLTLIYLHVHVVNLGCINELEI